MSVVKKTSYERLNLIAGKIAQQDIEHRRYGKDELLFEEGHASGGLFYIEEGTVLLTHCGDNGTDIVIRTAVKHDFIGYYSLIRGTNYTATARALKPVQVAFIPDKIFRTALNHNGFAQSFMKILCARIESIEDNYIDLQTKSVRQRLATVLVSFGDAYAGAGGDTETITLKKQDIASIVGVTPETLSRKLAEFEKEGLVELHIKGIVLKAPDALLRVANIMD